MTRRGEGEASFEVDGKTWRLRFDWNTLADFEQASGKVATTVIDAMGDGTGTMTDVRAMFWAALQEHHPGVGLREAGRLVAAGMQAFHRAAKSGLPGADDEADPAEKTTAATPPAA